MKNIVVLDFDGVASTQAAAEAREVLQSRFRQVQATVDDYTSGPFPHSGPLPQSVWMAVGLLIEMGHTLGARERLATGAADLRSALDETLRRLEGGK